MLGPHVSKMTLAGIVLVAGQIVAAALVLLREEVLGRTGTDWDVLVVLAVGALFVAYGAGIVFLVLVTRRLIHGVARVGVLAFVGSLIGMGDPDLFEDVVDEALEVDGEDGRVD
jgi:hypothetical protein